MCNRPYRAIFLLALVLLSSASPARGQVAFQQTNLVSSVQGLAPVVDANLKNPWGISYAPTGPFWISNQVTQTSTLYNGTGQPFPVGSPLVVAVPSAGNPSGPTGQVFNSTSEFVLSNNSPASFLFANLNGTISGWNGAAGTNALVAVSTTAVFTGLASGNNGSGNFLYAANGQGGVIQAYNGSFAPTSLAGSFTDPNLPSGFSPYNIQNLNNTLFVTYENETSGGGVVNAFDLNGNFLRRISANPSGGNLDDPWGLAIAPAGFGTFGGTLLGRQ